MRFGEPYDEDVEPRKWWPSRWPLWVWHIVFAFLALIVIVNSPTPLESTISLFETWCIIFGSIFIYRFVVKSIQRHKARQETAEARHDEEYHSLSPEENRIWNDLKNRLNK